MNATQAKLEYERIEREEKIWRLQVIGLIATGVPVVEAVRIVLGLREARV